MMSRSCKNFVHWHAVAGKLSILALALAALAATTGLAPWYALIREPLVGISAGAASLAKPLAAWLNQAGVALILFVAGLECKRAFCEEEWAGPERLRLPLVGALGGALASVAAYSALASGPEPGHGFSWAVPLGMEMALGLAVLAWLGERVPDALKAFFTAMALFSFLGSVVVGAVVQSGLPTWGVLAFAGFCIAVLLCLNLARISAVSPYLLAGAALWAALAPWAALSALSGPLAALFIPMRDREQLRTPLTDLEQDLLPTVCCIVTPALALINAGMFPQAGGEDAISTQRAVAMLLGLFPAKAAGVFGMCWLGVRLRVCALPAGVGWKEFAGAALLAGAGFTVNVFLGLALVGQGGTALNEIRLAALAASALSLASGYALLRYALARRRNKALQRT